MGCVGPEATLRQAVAKARRARLVLWERTTSTAGLLRSAIAWPVLLVHTAFHAAIRRVGVGFAQRAATRLLAVVPIHLAPCALLEHSFSHRGHPYVFLVQPVSFAQRELMSMVLGHAVLVVFLPSAPAPPALVHSAHQDFMRNHLLHPRALRVLREHFRR